MLSILIPTYNYNVYPLVEELYKQCLGCEIAFEIIVIDDCSEESPTENLKINNFPNCSLKILNKNIGRSAIRNLLAQNAKYEHLLFLDADTFPANNDFISNYLKQINAEQKIVYGGILYQKEKPEKKQLLRWVYGNKREALSVEKRNENPYLSFLTLNFLIKKSILKKVSFNESIPNLRYEDTLFSFDLKKSNILITHFENPVYHLGIESSDVFLKKTEESLIGLKYLMDNNLLSHDYVRLSKVFSKIKKLKLIFVFALFYKMTRLTFMKNLSSNNPSLLIFDLYRLGYLCSVKI